MYAELGIAKNGAHSSDSPPSASVGKYHRAERCGTMDLCASSDVVEEEEDLSQRPASWSSESIKEIEGKGGAFFGALGKSASLFLWHDISTIAQILHFLAT